MNLLRNLLAGCFVLFATHAMAQVQPGSSPWSVAKGGTGRATFTNHCVVLGAGTAVFGCLNGTGGNSSLPLLSQGASLDPIYSQLSNAGLVNSSITIGTTNVALGATAATIAGLTLTTPTINGAALSGTLSGSPIFSGVPVLSGLSAGTCANGIAIDSSNNAIKAACPGAAASIQVGTTTVTSGATANILFNNAGVLGNETVASVLTAGTGISITGTTNATIGLSTITGPGVLGASGSGAGQAIATVQAPILLNTLTASGSATLSDTTSFTSAYSMYELVFENIVPATAGGQCELQVHSGGSFQTTSYVGAFQNAIGTGAFAASAPTTFIACGSSSQNNIGPGISGRIRIHTPSSAAAPKQITGETAGNSTTPSGIIVLIYGYWNNSAAIDGFQVLMSAGNFSGVVKIYGYP